MCHARQIEMDGEDGLGAMAHKIKTIHQGHIIIIACLMH